MGKVISFENMKGGVGKTTLVYLFLASFQKFVRNDIKILAVDLDPQANLTSIIIPPKFQQYLDQINNSLFFEGKTEFKSHIYSSKLNGVDLVPSYIDLALVENEMRSDPLWPLRLKGGIDEIKAVYDLIIVDCPPNIGPMTINAIVASDDILVPVTPDTMAMVGYTRIKTSVQKVHKLNQNVKVSALIVNMVDRRYNAHNAFIELLQHNKDLPRIIGPITRRAAIFRIVELGKTISEELFAVDSNFHIELEELVNAVLDIGQVGGQLPPPEEVNCPPARMGGGLKGLVVDQPEGLIRKTRR